MWPRPWPPSARCWASSSRTEVGPGPPSAPGGVPRVSPDRAPPPLPAGETIQGLRSSLRAAIETLSRVDSSVAVSSGGELFLRFISLTSLEYSVRAPCPERQPLREPPASQRGSRCLAGLLQVQRNHDRARGDLPDQSLRLEEQNRQAVSSFHQGRGGKLAGAPLSCCSAPPASEKHKGRRGKLVKTHSSVF